MKSTRTRCRRDFEPILSKCAMCGRVFKTPFGLAMHESFNHKPPSPTRLGMLKRDRYAPPEGGYSNDTVAALHDRVAGCLGWSVEDCQSFSLSALAAFVREKDPKLEEDIRECVRLGQHVLMRPKR